MKLPQLFSTDLLPLSERSDAWLWRARQICGDCRIELPRTRSFHGTIDRRTLGGLPLTQFSSSPISFWKWPSEPAHSDHHSIVITQFRGAQRYLQAGANVLLKPGDSTLIDSARPWSSQCETDCKRVYLRVPHWLMQDRLQTTDLPLAPRIPGNTRMGAALFRLTASMCVDSNAGQPDPEDSGALDAYFDLLSACLGLPAPDSGLAHSSQAFLRIQRFIEENLGEPELTPSEIAARVGISLRHLHRLFSVRGHSVGEWIRVRRLEKCRRDLTELHLRDRTITDIAFYWGFCDSAHFSRSFRKQFGVSPRSFRNAACVRAGNEAREQTTVRSVPEMRRLRLN